MDFRCLEMYSNFIVWASYLLFLFGRRLGTFLARSAGKLWEHPGRPAAGIYREEACTSILVVRQKSVRPAGDVLAASFAKKNGACLLQRTKRRFCPGCFDNYLG
jgi:hypothetical protein